MLSAVAALSRMVGAAGARAGGSVLGGGGVGGTGAAGVSTTGAAALSAVSFSGRKAATNPSRTLHMLGWLGSHMAVTSAFSWMSAGLGRCESLLREGWVSE